MREIKFRAWERHELGGGRMIINAPNLMLDVSHGIPYWQFGFEEPKPMSDTILMQYTGLTDKNRKEVYEGDVFGGTWEMHYVAYCEKQASFEMFNCLKECSACNGDVHWSEMVDDKELEVIGNIYENPELLDPDPDGYKEPLDFSGATPGDR